MNATGEAAQLINGGEGRWGRTRGTE